MAPFLEGRATHHEAVEALWRDVKPVADQLGVFVVADAKMGSTSGEMSGVGCYICKAEVPGQGSLGRGLLLG